MNTAVQIKNTILAGASAIGAFIISLIGGWDGVAIMLIAVMIADYLSGVAVAAFWQKSNKSDTGALDSKAGYKGLCKKVFILFLVVIATLFDTMVGTTFMRNSVMMFFIGNECVSLLENAGLMGVPYPEWMRKAFEALRDKGDVKNGNTGKATDSQSVQQTGNETPKNN